MVRFTPESLRNYSGFTLVELIIVISLLTILGTIGFISIQNFYGSARDSVRVSDIQSIYQGLSLYKAKADFFPIPESPIEIKAGTETLSYQGYTGESLSRVIKMNKSPTDPIDLTRYICTVDKTRKKSQLMGYLESGEIRGNTAYLDSLITLSYADTNSIDYKNRFVYVYGNKIGVLTDENNAPIQETFTGMVDLSSTDTTGYIAYFGGDTYGAGKSTGSGVILTTQMQGAINDTIPCNPLSYSGYTITPLSHNETKTFTKPITIADGTATGSLQVTCINGTVDIDHAIETTNISCNANFVNQSNSCVPDVCGGVPPVSSHSTATSQTIAQNWTQNSIPGICTFDCNTNYTWNSINGTCDANTQTFTCSAKPANTNWNTVGNYLQTWNGTIWTPVNSTNTYNITPSTTECHYQCSTGFHTENAGASCISNTQTTACSGLPANAVWNTVSSITQTWNGTIWTPTTVGSYNTTASAAECRYRCNTPTYIWDGDSCEPAFPLATSVGGTITTSGNYRIHTFTAGGTFTPSGAGTAEYLVVAGGGGGASAFGGGGGGGGVLAGSISVTVQGYTIVVGNGGNKGTGPAYVNGSVGGNSSFAGLTALGGGYGGAATGAGGSGGSGGGGGQNNASGNGTAGQGYAGSAGGNNGANTIASARGGGGAGGAGVTNGIYAGIGGPGLQSSISGTAKYYGGGGGGGAASTVSGGTGGSGIGGSGAGGVSGGTGGGSTVILNGADGTINTGGGGGGGGYTSTPALGNGGTGGSGIVIIRYQYQ